jgi:hypothetical protein
MNFNDLNIHFTHRTMMGICIGLAMLVCITFTYSAWQWRSDWVLAHEDTARMPVIAKNDTNNLIASIPENHIFGKAMSQMPITNLQMRVTGIVKMSGQSGASKAYISVEGQPSKIYQVGDDLPNGVTINTISGDAVILDIEGRLEKLPLPREKLQFKSRPKESF